jgi:crossover junction endodeoxyribonuclease RusA
MITLTLPFPPSANRYWRNFRGRMVKSADARIYRDQAGYIYLQQTMRINRGRPLIGDVKVTLDFYRPAKRGDLDNRIKVTLDALQGIAFADDSQVVEIHARRFEGKANPRVEIAIENISSSAHNTLPVTQNGS